jgi:hypothetical protein
MTQSGEFWDARKLSTFSLDATYTAQYEKLQSQLASTLFKNPTKIVILPSDQTLNFDDPKIQNLRLPDVSFINLGVGQISAFAKDAIVFDPCRFLLILVESVALASK